MERSGILVSGAPIAVAFVDHGPAFLAHDSGPARRIAACFFGREDFFRLVARIDVHTSRLLAGYGRPAIRRSAAGSRTVI